MAKDVYGNWIYEPNIPEEKKCDFDILADEILRQIEESNDQCGENEQIETSIENLVVMIYLHFKDEIDDMIDDIKIFREENPLMEVNQVQPVDWNEMAEKMTNGYSLIDYTP